MIYIQMKENYTLFREQKAPEKFLHSSLLARKFDCACTVSTHSNVICKCGPEITLTFILKYLSEKVMGKQDLAGSPCSHANRLYSQVVPWRKCGNIILPARQQSAVLLIVSPHPFFFFFIMLCINFLFTWFAVSRFVGCRGNKLWAFITSRLHSDQIQQCDKILGSCAIAVQQWESHLINIAGPIVCHQTVLCSCAIAKRCPHYGPSRSWYIFFKWIVRTKTEQQNEREYFHTECNYDAVKKQHFYFWIPVDFFSQTYTLQTNSQSWQ